MRHQRHLPFCDLGRRYRIASVTAELRSSQFLMQCLSVALQRGDATLELCLRHMN